MKYLPLGIFVLALDQTTKVWARTIAVGESVPVVDGLLSWTHVHNTGSAFGMLQNQNALLIVISVVALYALYHYHEQFKTDLEQAGMMLIIAGILGNFIDRIWQGFVTDFIDLGWWPVFNVADSALCVGVGLLIVAEIRKNFGKVKKTSAYAGVLGEKRGKEMAKAVSESRKKSRKRYQ